LKDVSSLELYRLALGARLAEQRVTELAQAGELYGHHSGLNHEAIGTGIGAAVEFDDAVQTSYRSGAAVMHARGGVTVAQLVAQGFGLIPGPRDQHPGGPRTLRSTGILAGQVPTAVGVALAFKLRGHKHVVVSVTGDGTANQGALHESMNIAGVRRLPILFVIENNGIALSTPYGQSTAAARLADRAIGYGMRAETIDGHDAETVFDAVAAALERIRSGAGAELLEIAIDRPGAHVSNLRDIRTPEQLAMARRIDCIQVMRDRLIAEGKLDPMTNAAMVHELSGIVDGAVAESRDRRTRSAEPGQSAPMSDAEAWRLAHASPPPQWMDGVRSR
jgi:TPP-dependent pyruvate/acetoin dehydrogenase alpha subunit